MILPQASEDVAHDWWRSTTVWELFSSHASQHPERIALSDPPNRADVMHGKPRTLSYAQVQDEVLSLAQYLSDLGARRGDVLLVQLPNCVESVLVFLAAARLGVIFSPLPVQYREYELRHLIDQARPRWLLTASHIDGHAHAAMAQQLAAQSDEVRVLAYGDALPAGVLPLAQLPACDGALGDLPHANTPLTLCWTSGTEGRSKGVPRTHAQWLCLTKGVVDAASMRRAAVLLNPFPIAGMAAFVGFILPWLYTGGTLQLHHPFELSVFVAQLSSGSIDFTAAPPALLSLMLARADIAARARLDQLGFVGCGGAPLNPALVAGFHERFGVHIVNLYGSTEGGSLISGPQDVPDPYARATCFPRWGVAGYEWESTMADLVETRLVDPATESEIDTPGRPGELRFRGPGIFSGYHNAPEATAAAFDAQGYYRSGDLFEIAGERQQYYRYVGRCKDLVIRGGVNIAPEEVEGLLASHPDVAEVAVIGYPDPVMGEKLCAVVVARGAAQPPLQLLRSYLQNEHKVAAFKLPERVEWLSALPRSATGKVLKRVLREQLNPPAQAPCSAASE